MTTWRSAYTDLGSLAHLARGNSRQRSAAACLRSLRLFSTLDAFEPVVAGTIPIDIDGPASDIDVLCEACDLEGFATRVVERYGVRPAFRAWKGSSRGTAAWLAAFEHVGFAIEIFAQPIPVEAQYGYRHMIAEARLMDRYGRPLRDAIRRSKAAGVKTEPAFAQVLGMAGDPYEAVASVYAMTPVEFSAFVAAHQLQNAHT